MNQSINHKYFKNLRMRVEQETPYGLYVWKMPDGRYVGDGEGRLMAIASAQGDLKRIAKLAAEAKALGIEEGEPHYMPDKYPVSDHEYEEQQERMESGIMADPADPGNLSDMDGR